MRAWVIVERGLVGTETQAAAIAEALGADVSIKRFTLGGIWGLLAPWLISRFMRGYVGDPLDGPQPDIIISAGRKAATIARGLKRAYPQNAERPFYVHLLDPRGPISDFDLVAVPHHDTLRGPRVCVTDGAPNHINQQRLAIARAQWATSLGALPSPLIAVLIGGNSRTHKLDEAGLYTLAQALREIADKTGGTLLVTLSRRSGPKALTLISEALAGTGALIWDGSGQNPYLGYLSMAHFIFVTSDSVSMISEAASTGTPVYILPLKGGNARFKRFYGHLEALGVARTFRGQIERWAYTPLADAAKVAARIQKDMKKHDD